MTTLLKTLNSILNWQQQNNLESIESLQPGLSIAEIEALIINLPFQVSREFYELYQWRNGGYLFFPLEIALEEYGKMMELSEDSFYPLWNPYWLPITDDFNSGYPTEDLQGYRVIAGGKEIHDTSLLLNIDFECPEPGIWYPSITNLMLATLEECQIGSSQNDVESHLQYRSMIDNLQASVDQYEEEGTQHFFLDHTRNLIQQSNAQIQNYESGLSPEVMEVYTQGSIHEKYNPGGNYLSIWHHRKEVAEHSDGSKIETRYDPDTGMISGIKICSATGKTEELNYYYQGKPVYCTFSSYERPDCYQYSRTETWLGIHDVFESISVICKDGMGRTKTERRFIDGNLIKEVNYPID
jgi:hypothetical protein